MFEIVMYRRNGNYWFICYRNSQHWYIYYWEIYFDLFLLFSDFDLIQLFFDFRSSLCIPVYLFIFLSLFLFLFLILISFFWIFDIFFFHSTNYLHNQTTSLSWHLPLFLFAFSPSLFLLELQSLLASLHFFFLSFFYDSDGTNGHPLILRPFRRWVHLISRRLQVYVVMYRLLIMGMIKCDIRNNGSAVWYTPIWCSIHYCNSLPSCNIPNQCRPSVLNFFLTRLTTIFKVGYWTS